MNSLIYSFNIRSMKLYSDQRGVANVLLIPLIISAVLLVASIGFGAWAFTSRQDYKDNVDQKIAAAIKINSKEVSDQKDNEFLEKEKYPLSTYQAPDQLGAVKISYPKTWSAYISEEEDSAEYIFSPKYISSNSDVPAALRVTVEASSYSDTLSSYDSKIADGELKAKAYSLPRVENVVGVRLDGAIDNDVQGSLVILPLRDKTLVIANEVPNLVDDFNNKVLANITFNP